MDLTPPGDDLRPEDEPSEPLDGPDRMDGDDPPEETSSPADGAPDAAVPDAADMPPAPPDDADAASIWMDPDYVPPAPEPAARSWGGLLPGILIVVLALGLIAVTLWGIREYRQRTMMQNAAQEALGLITAGAPPELVKEMSAILACLTAGQADQAAQRLANLRTAIAGKRPGAAGAGTPGMPGAGGEPIPESAYNDLPPDAAKFFRQHQDLFRQFLLMCAKARQLKEQGQNVDELRKVRDRAIEAARLGQQPEVEQHLGTMVKMLGGPGGADKRGPLGHRAEQLKREMQRANAQGRDVRAAFPLMKKAEAAAQAGNLGAAEKYVDQALAAVRAAPRGRMPRGGRGDVRGRMMRMRQGPGNPLAPFVRALLGVMSAEEGNLKVVTDELLQMRQLLLNDKPETPTEPQALSPLIDRAMGELKTVAKRRQELTKAMRGPGGKGRPGPLPPGGRRQQLTAEQRREMFTILLARLTPLLEDIRTMPASDYEAQRASLIREIVRAVLEPPRPDTPPVSRPAPLPADPEQRVRVKMLEASKVLKQWELEGKDTTQVEDLFAQARKALYAKQFDEAEKLVDEARKLLGMVETPDSAGTVGKPPGSSGGLDDSAIELNLRGRP